MHLESGDLKLRRFREDDCAAMVALAADADVSRYLADRFPHPYGIADAERWIAATRQEAAPYNFAVEWRGRLAGGAGLVPLTDIHSGTAEVGYWLGKEFWGGGLATIAAGLLTAYGLDELLFVRLQALVFSENPASMRVLEKNGYVREGVLRKHVRKRGRIMDAVLYAKLRNA